MTRPTTDTISGTIQYVVDTDILKDITGWTRGHILKQSRLLTKTTVFNITWETPFSPARTIKQYERDGWVVSFCEDRAFCSHPDCIIGHFLTFERLRRD